ncbi:FadR/GntR family transcriptional regulator [Streptomyces sp. NPDC055815]
MSEPSPRGTYLLIADGLRQEIAQGAYEDGSLPSEASLADKYGVSRNTVRRALKRLESDRLISSVPGAGWRVSSAPVRPLAERLAEVIGDDSLSVGDRFPSESQLCERFAASRTAVRRALAQMEGAGLLLAIHGKGRIVQALPTSPSHP